MLLESERIKKNQLMDNLREPHLFPVEPEGGWSFNLGFLPTPRRPQRLSNLESAQLLRDW